MESGIDKHVRAQFDDLYKFSRIQHWMNRQKVVEPTHVGLGLSPELMLFLLVLFFGYSIAGLTFLMELFFFRKNDVVRKY